MITNFRGPYSLKTALYTLELAHTDFYEAGIDLPEPDYVPGGKPYIFHARHEQNGLILETSVVCVPDELRPTFATVVDFRLAAGPNPNIISLNSHAGVPGYLVRKANVVNCSDFWLTGRAPSSVDGIETAHIAKVDMGRAVRYMIARFKGERFHSYEKETR